MYGGVDFIFLRFLLVSWYQLGFFLFLFLKDYSSHKFKGQQNIYRIK